jgi:hypothetical protein
MFTKRMVAFELSEKGVRTMETTWKVIRAYIGVGTAEPCRRCDRGIPAADEFGRSEGVCRDCR